MRKSAVILVIVLAVVLVFAISYYDSFKSGETDTAGNIEETSDSKVVSNFDSKSSNEGGVTVVVTPISLFDDSEVWSFEVILDTHSVDLSYDIAALTTLIDQDGNTYSPIGWEGDPPGGHHRGGVLSFTKIEPQPTSATLLLHDIGVVEERAFEWSPRR